MSSLPPLGSTASSLVDATLDNTIGAAFIGAVIAAFLFGFSSLQAYLYYHHWYHDTLIHRVSVGVLWVLDATHLAFTCHAVYHYVITEFGRAENLIFIVGSIKLQIAINVVIILMVQSLYAYRVWKLGGYHNGVLGYIVSAVVAGGFVVGIVLAYEVYTIHTFPDLSNVAWAIDSALATSTVIDFVISSAMCYYLAKSKGSETRLNSRISRVMQYTLSSGLFTSGCSLAALFTYILLPNTMIFFAIESLLTKLYVGSFFTMLNARERASDKQDVETSGSSFSLPRFSRKSSKSSSRRALTLKTPTLDMSSRYSDAPSVYSDASSHYSKVPWSSQSDKFTSFPSPDKAKLGGASREGESPVTPSQKPSYMSKW